MKNLYLVLVVLGLGVGRLVAGAPCADISGDVNADGVTDLSDAVYSLAFSFLGGAPPEPFCGPAGPNMPDCTILSGDGNGDGGIDLSDAVYLLDFLFQGGPAPLPGCPDAAAGVYPAGPYGTAVGDIIEDLEFISHLGGPLHLSDLRALEGARFINLSTVAGWCGPCIRKMASFDEVQQGLRPSGFIGVISIYQGQEGAPAEAEDAERWRFTNGMTGVVVADPVPVMAPYFPSFGPEKYLLIDALTMEIIHISETFVPTELSLRAEAWLDN